MKLLRPLAKTFQCITDLRNYFFDKGWFKSTHVDCPVVSIGNLTVGGTGKTPVVDHLLSWCRDEGITAALISRGYGGDCTGPEKVDLSSSIYYGDEPTLLAMKHPETDIYVGSGRVSVAQFLLKHRRPQIIFLDDGFQHRWIHRDFDIVVVDVSVDLQQYQLLPEGRARETLSALGRADAVVFNKINMVTVQKYQEVKDHMQPFLRPDCLILEGCYQPGQVISISTHDDLPKTGRALLFSGLGRPEAFSATVQELGYQVMTHLPFADHHRYSKSDIENVVKTAQDLSCDLVLTTEKDGVKLAGFKELFTTPAGVVPIRCDLLGADRTLYGQVSKLIL